MRLISCFNPNLVHPKVRETHRLSLLRSLDPIAAVADADSVGRAAAIDRARGCGRGARRRRRLFPSPSLRPPAQLARSEEHTSELQSLRHLVCRLLLEK